MRKTKSVKLSEDVIQDQNVAPAQAIPASNQEVQNAAESTVTNDMMADGTIAAEDPNNTVDLPIEDPNAEVPAEEDAIPEQPRTFTAPVEGMIPAGWVNPKELGQAIAMETGDVQPAETAQDVQVAEQDDSIAAAPVDTTVEDQPLVNDQMAEKMTITKDELNMILEYREYLKNKIKESKTAKVGDKIKIIEMANNHRYVGKVGIVKSIKEGQIFGTWGHMPLLENIDSYKILKRESINPSLEVAEEDEKNETSAGAPDVTKIEPAPLTESEEDSAIIEDKLNLKDGSETSIVDETGEVDPTALQDSPENDVEEDVVEDVSDDVELEKEDDAEDGFEDEDFEDDELLDRIDYFLANDTDDEIARTAFENTADLLDNVFDYEDEVEEDSEEEGVKLEDLNFTDEDSDGFDSDDFDDEFEEDEEDFEDDFEEDFEEDFDEEEDIPSEPRKASIKEKIIYPAGSSPSPERFENEDNLYEAYKKRSLNKRRALEEYRQSMRESSYGKALRGVTKLEEDESYDEKSWKANKIRESEKLNYKDLLNNGFLG